MSASPVSVKIDGAAKLLAWAKAAEAKAVQAMKASLYQHATAIMNESQKQVPVDTGVLKASGTVRQPTVSGGVVTVELGYGGAASAYAWPQHERTDYVHRVGKAGYLRDPVVAAMRDLPASVMRNVQSELLR